MKGKPLFIRAEWDEEARVWVASSDDVPGLATEGDTLEGLVDKLKVMIPELLEANGTAGGRNSLRNIYPSLAIRPTRFSSKPDYQKSFKPTQ